MTSYTSGLDQKKLILLLGLCAVIGFSIWAIRKMIRLWPSRIEKNRKNNSFQIKMARAFALFVAIPCFVLASFSIFFLHIGIHTWFDRRVQIAVQGADDIAQHYLKEKQSLIEFFSNTLNTDLKKTLLSPQDFGRKNALALKPNPLLTGEFLNILNRHETLQNTHIMIFSPRNNIFSSKTSILQIVPHTVSKEGGWLSTLPLKMKDLKKARSKGLYIRSTQDMRYLLSFMPLEGVMNTFVLMCLPINPTILERTADTKNATATYQSYLKTQKYWVSMGIVIFIIFAIFLILIAMIGGLSFAQLTIRPITALIQASEDMRQGQTPLIALENIPATNELRSLMSVFNSMSKDVGAKTMALNQANHNLNIRNLFIESVLQGVSSGVMSLRSDARIVFANATAQKMLPFAGRLEGKSLLEIAPEFQPLFEKALMHIGIVHSDPITLMRDHHARTFRLHVQCLMETDTLIITLDDISSLIAAQKKSAWSDVACRIAHEIKNPLTPIALSAERLRRRYIKEIQNEPEVFQDCIDTIIRQVQHIGNLISEFSDFARLPQPKLSHIDLNFLLVQLIVFHQQAYPNITFEYARHPVQAYCDAQQIEQVLTNILKNAIESIQETHRPDGKIVVSLAQNDAWTTLSIQDNGAGLSPDKALLLCEPYQTTKAEGMGLGLAIVQKIIDDHGGLFSIQPVAHGVGACITLSLPKNG